jgi:hypothetical protein
MSHKSRTGPLVGVAATAGAFGALAIVAAATAPTARADDFSPVINAVDADFAAATEDFNSAYSDFGSSELGPGFASFLDGVDDDLLAAPQNLLVGTVEVLDSESVAPPLTWSLVPEASFAGGLSQAEADFSQGEVYLNAVTTALTSGEYGYAAYDGVLGSDLVSIVPLEDLLLGSLASF